VPIRKEFRKFYGREWQLVIRPRIRARAGDKCEQCGSHNGDIGYRDRAGNFVTTSATARLVPFVPFPPDDQPDAKLVLIQCGAAHLNNIPGDDRDDNLAWLCRGCHLHHDQPVHTRNAHTTRAVRKDAKRPLLQEKESMSD
jgi:hypothetical protein